MTRDEFAALHSSADPLILYNIWDAGSAAAVARSGAKAIATGSHSLAGAQGYSDAEAIPFEALLTTVRQIKAAIDLPLTIDFEAGFAEDVSELSENARALVEAGAVGCNFEDQLIVTGGLRDPSDQAERIAVVAEAGLFVNARTDTFLEALRAGDDPNQQTLVDEALDRARVYAAPGAGCFFIPGLSNPDMIAQVCQSVSLPVNVMRLPKMMSNADLASLGVSRISYGPGPWNDAMMRVEEEARAALSS